MGVTYINPYRFGFNPLSLSPALWLDAADTSTITSSGSPAKVSQWNDKSGNGRNVTQGTGVNQPSTGVNTQNARNLIDFSGSGVGTFLSAGITAVGRNVSGMTIYVVVKFASNPTTLQVPIRIANGTNGFARVVMDAGLTSQRTRTGGRTLDADSFQSFTGSVTIGTSFITHTGVFDYANTDLYSYVGSTLDASTTSFQSATTTSDTDSLNIQIGTDNGSSNFMNGSIAEILIYHSAHSATTRQIVWDYLNAKWAL